MILILVALKLLNLIIEGVYMNTLILLVLFLLIAFTLSLFFICFKNCEDKKYVKALKLSALFLSTGSLSYMFLFMLFKLQDSYYCGF